MTKSAKLLIAALMAIALFSFSDAALAADSWGLPDEEEVRFDAKVIDVLCVLSGDCPPDCGAGKRLLGLLKEDGELVLPIKNGGPFTGAVADLLPHCGETVTADGLFTINYGVKTFAVQFLRPAQGKWRRANGFVNEWAAMRGLEAKDKAARRWFRSDETILEIIGEQGKLGLKDKGIEP
ncbi:MAG: hypothetical protein QF449_00475 [Alphaproteobacteria bacterium]|jgi:hypothetical protein|nr:hypothetical protein [Alphaproteobacteria bacterium]MDP6589164.1 hypothetical protein [Alphaproteobacteria bacterium]MDP6816497.1 hypothetical protein [Alphaproteobacteria bacterium]|tara:strand:- start:21 stop:560 length:540 start_codon:yes stop_codon:yes gene_type:complete